LPFFFRSLKTLGVPSICCSKYPLVFSHFWCISRSQPRYFVYHITLLANQACFHIRFDRLPTLAFAQVASKLFCYRTPHISFFIFGFYFVGCKALGILKFEKFTGSRDAKADDKSSDDPLLGHARIDSQGQ